MLYFLLLVTVFATNNLVHAAAAGQPQDNHQKLTYDEARQKVSVVLRKTWDGSLLDKENIVLCTKLFQQYPKLLTKSVMLDKNDTFQGEVEWVLPLQAAVQTIRAKLYDLVSVEEKGTPAFKRRAEIRFEDEKPCIAFVKAMVKLGADKNKFAGNGLSPFALANSLEGEFGEVPQVAGLREALRTPEVSPQASPRAAQSDSE